MNGEPPPITQKTDALPHREYKEMPLVEVQTDARANQQAVEETFSHFAGSGTEMTNIKAEAELLKGVILVHMNISGLVHISNAKIDTFSDKKVSVAGKFGVRGVYFAAGNYGGETLDALRADPNTHEHSTEIEGNFVVVEYGKGPEGPNQRLLRFLEEKRGIPKSIIGTIDIRGDYIDLLENVQINGKTVDGVVILFPEKGIAEVVVARKSTPKIKINRVTSGGAK